MPITVPERHRSNVGMGTMTLPELSSALIRVFEGCRLTAFQDTGGIWSIGFSHTGPDVILGLTITMEQAEMLLQEDQKNLFAMVAGKPLLEAAALVSFGYNCGAGALTKVINGTSQLTDYVKDRRGNTLPGLESRRNLEQALILASRS